MPSWSPRKFSTSLKSEKVQLAPRRLAGEGWTAGASPLGFLPQESGKLRIQKMIEINNATVYRGATKVFDNLSLEITRGCNTAILGPNGSGKSTLLKLLSCELYPVAREGSSVRLFGQKQWNVWELRSHLGIVSDDLQTAYLGSAPGRNVILSGLFSSINVWSHQHVSPEEEERANRIMDMLAVAELKDRPFAAMSTGQKRRFLLGRALVNNPETLVLDEPTSGLDLQACFQYLDIVRGLMQAGKTVILVTQHIHEIPPEISRVVLLKDGKVISDGEKSAILTSESLSNLFGIPIQLLQVNGFYQAVPGTS